MKQVTRNIDPESAHDLLERAPRACIAFAGEDGPMAQPVVLVWRDGRYLIGIPESVGHLPASGQEVVLLVDEGFYYFDLRAIYVRGEVQAVQPPTEAAGHSWFEAFPSKVVAWDYGQLREVNNDR